jgi:hypothetical protein
MGRLNGVQILILDTLFAHFQELIQNTKTDEADDVFITKLSLSLGRGESDNNSEVPFLIEEDSSDSPPIKGIRRNTARPHPLPPLH